MAKLISRGRFGTNLHRARTAIPGMTQKKLQFLYNGNSDNNSFINKLEQQDSAPGLEVVAALARALDCSEATLLAGVPDRGPQMSHRDRQILPTPPGSEETAPVTDPQLRHLIERWALDPSLRALFTLWPDLTPLQRHELAERAFALTKPHVPAVPRKK